MILKMTIPGACFLALAAATALSQDQTYSVSPLGTFDAPQFLQSFTSKPLADGYPWGTQTVNSSDPYTEAPNTGVTRHYQFTLSRAQLAADGYQKKCNNYQCAVSRPMIEANWGDYIEGK